MNRTIEYDRFGDLDDLVMRDRPAPRPGPREVLVAVERVGLNPVDAKTVMGALPVRPLEALSLLRSPSRWFGHGEPRFPRVVGRDFSGTVEAVGDAVRHVAPGDRVLGTLRSAPGSGSRRGSLTEHLVASASDVVAAPTGLDRDVAGALGVVAQTACGSLRALGVGSGDVIVVAGASGGVGSLVTQLALRRGATVIGIAGSSSADLLNELGAIPVSYDGDVAQEIRACAPEEVTTLLDCHGGYLGLARALGVPARRTGTFVPAPAVALRRAVFTGSRDAHPRDLPEVARLVAAGEVSVDVARVLPFELDPVRAGYRELLAGHVRGRLVVRVA